MARRTLYPTLPGESAVDRLLNQTLPQLVKDRQASAERAQQRQDTLDARKQSQENFDKNFTYVTEQDRLKEDTRKDEKISSHFSKATSFSLTGNDEEAETEYQQGLFWAKKYGRNASDFGSETSRIKIDKVRGINDTYENNFTVFNSLNPTKDQVTTANRNILNIYNDLTDSQKAEYRFKIETNKNDAAFVGIQMQERELEFFAFNSKLYDQTLGKKSGFDNLTAGQQEIILGKIPLEQRIEKPDATKEQKKARDKAINEAYRASELYESVKELAKKYVDDTVNQYGSWESLSQEINGMSEFNRDLHIERLGIGLINSGEAKDQDEVVSYLLNKGVSQETLDASEMFKDDGGDNNVGGDDGTGIDQATLDVTRARSIERTMGETGTATKQEIDEYNVLKKKYKVKSFGTIGKTYDSKTEGSKSRELASSIQNKNTKPNSMTLEEFKDEKDSINKYYENVIKQERDIIDSLQDKDLTPGEKRESSKASKDRIELLQIQRKKELAELRGNQKAVEAAVREENKIIERINKYSRGEGPNVATIGPESRVRGEQGALGQGAGTFLTTLGQPIQR